jgi:hypothetical protein
MKSNGACPNPLIMDFLHKYLIPLNDLKVFIEGNISSVDLGTFNDTNVKFSDVLMTTVYTDNKKADRSTPMKVIVKQDSFEISLAWTANVTYSIGKHQTYAVEASLKPL